MKTRLFAILPDIPTTSKVKHYLGLPPELTGGKDARREMGPALYLVIEQEPDGVFLYRYDADGQFVGDTWHQNLEEAKGQAAYEYDNLIETWHDVPSDVADAAAFALKRATASRHA